MATEFVGYVFLAETEEEASVMFLDASVWVWKSTNFVFVFSLISLGCLNYKWMPHRTAQAELSRDNSAPLWDNVCSVDYYMMTPRDRRKHIDFEEYYIMVVTRYWWIQWIQPK